MQGKPQLRNNFIDQCDLTKGQESPCMDVKMSSFDALKFGTEGSKLNVIELGADRGLIQ